MEGARANDCAWHVGCGAAFGAKHSRGSSLDVGQERMNDIKKLFVSVYLTLFAATIIAAFWNGLGVIDLKEGTIHLMLWGFSIAMIPAAITAFRTHDFWKDDPESVAKIKKENLHTIAQAEARHGEAMAQKNKAIVAESERADREAKECARLRGIIRPKPPSDQTYVS
jgi:hypothetical protein